MDHYKREKNLNKNMNPVCIVILYVNTFGSIKTCKGTSYTRKLICTDNKNK